MLKWVVDFDYKYLTEDQLKGFQNYKYSSIDTNPLSVYVMHPFWNGIVHIFPKWVAPNLLTFVGFLMTITAVALLSYYDWHYFAGTGMEGSQPVPNWIFMLVSILVFLAYTLDGIDGKQARRTGTTGPLGELFDHGLDSWTAVLIPVCLYSVFGRNDHGVTTLRYYGVCWNVFLTFYTTHWEKYITGVLFLPWGYDLSMLATTVVFFVSYWLGHDGWKVQIFGQISSGRLLEIIFYASSLLATLPVSVFNITRSYKEGKAKRASLPEALRPLIPLFGLLISSYLWALQSDIVARQPRVFFLLTGTIFSNITCRLVVSQMSASTCEIWNHLVTLHFITYLLATYLPLLETFLLYTLCIGSTYAHIHYGACVVRQMCHHFRIKCFKIKDS